MEVKKTTVQFIKEAATKLKNCKMKKLTTAQTKLILEGVMTGVGLKTIRQAILFVPMFDNSCRCINTDMDDIANYLGCSTLDIVEYVPELNDMMTSGFIRQSDQDCIDIMRQSYIVNEDVLSAIIEGKKVSPKPEQQNTKFDKYDFCKIVSKWVENGDVTLKSLTAYVIRKESEYSHIKFIKDVCAVVSNIEDRILFYEMCDDFLCSDGSGDGQSDINATISDIYEHINQRIACKKILFDGSHPLITAGLIMIKGSDRESMSLTDKGEQLFLDDDIASFSQNYNNLDRYSFAKALFDFISVR